MVHCRACGVTTSARNYGITFHRFPKNENQKCAWINFCNKDKRLDKSVNYTTLCSQHFDESCFDRTSAMKVRLKPFSMPTIHVLRSKYEKIDASICSQTESINETSLTNRTTNTSTDIASINCNSNMDIFMIMEKSTVNDILQMSKSQLIEQTNVDIEFQLSNRNIDIESLPSTNLDIISHKTDVSLEILPSDTSKEVTLKKKIVSLGRLLADKSNVIRKLQKKNWNQRKQIFKLKSIINELI
ncbi:PREDICTED: uncharacterized protein LOC108763883 [Trachymyrmex cornetzi]|uniref:uncharacterized protein LOC108763883 n=1 Tax=Trachymyrmex cornetzi TaxID=471704 RepID=UPI00084ED64F|nr:PREDICTED: uncharacterized protein LOC108763883 [Trachymyrmex cornetzi]